MSKRIIGWLLVVCLCVGLLPVVALADTSTKVQLRILSWIDITAEKGGEIGYLKNSEYTGYVATKDADGNITGYTEATGWTQVKATADDWNIKFEWPADAEDPILTIKDAKMAMVTEDGQMLYKKKVDAGTGEVTYSSQNSVSAILPKSGTANIINLNLVVEGDNLIEVNNGIVRGAVGSSQYFKNVTITGKDGGKITGSGRGIGISPKAGYTLTLDGVNLNLHTTTSAGGTPVPIRTEKADIIIKNSTIKCGNNFNVAIGALEGGNILVENSNVKVTSQLKSTAGPGCFYAQDGIVTITGEKTVINATGKNNSCIMGNKGIIIEGGELNLNSAYYALYTGNDGYIKVNGGTTKIIAQNACNTAVTLGKQIVCAYAGANEAAAEIYDGTDPNLAKRPWMVMSDKELDIQVTEPPTLPPIFVDPTGTDSQPTQAPTIAPTQAPTGTNATNGANNGANNGNADKGDGDKGENGEDSGSSSILLIVAAAVVVLGGAAVAVIVIKRKKA